MPALVAVDCTADRLVRIDPATAEARVIGLLGRDVVEVDLAWHDDRLLAIDSITGDHVDLLEIDVTTGSATFLAELTLDGEAITTAEGLASFGGVLYVGFRNGGPSWASGHLAEVALDGTLSQVVDLSDDTVQADLDAFGLDAVNGQLLAFDTQTTDVVVQVVRPTEGLLDPVGSFPRGGPVGAVHDLTTFDGSIFGIDAANASLHRIDPVTGARLDSSVVIPAGEYRGIASVLVPDGPPPAPPCPSDLDGNGETNFADLVALLAVFGSCPGDPCPGDLDQSGAVDFPDLLLLLAAYGPCP